MDACRARHVHRTQLPSHRVDPFHVCVNSPSASLIFGASSPRPQTAGLAAGVPTRGCGRGRQPPTTPLPRPVRRPLSKLPRSPHPPAPAARGPAAGNPGRKAHRVSLLVLPLAAPAPLGSLRAVPAPRAPAGRAGRLRPDPRSGVGPFLTNFSPSSSLLRAKKEAEAPYFFPQSYPSHQHLANSRAVGGSERRGEPFRVSGPFGAAARSHPDPGLQ